MFSEIYEQHHLTVQSLEDSKNIKEEDCTLLVIDTNELRREMFKKFYAKSEEKFGLYEKADASEFLQTLLEMIHYCLNDSKEEKKDEDTTCKGKCNIHKMLQLNLRQTVSCKCAPEKERNQDFHGNYFQIVLNSFQIINQINLNDEPVGCLMKIQKKIVKEELDDICVNGNPKCTYQQSLTKIEISDPLPGVTIFNINWFMDEASYEDILKILISIPHSYTIGDLYDYKDESESGTYVLKAVVCFVGAHYFSFVKQVYDKQPVWKKLNDDSDIEIYADWTQVILEQMPQKSRPSILVYEKLTEKNQDFDANENLDKESMVNLILEAKKLENFDKQFSNKY